MHLPIIKFISPLVLMVSIMVLFLSVVCMGIGCSNHKSLQIEIEGEDFPLPVTLAELEKRLGKWDRYEPTYFYVWDDIGITGFASSDSEDWAVIIISISKTQSESKPWISDQQFRGTLKIDGFFIDKDTTLDDLMNEGYEVHPHIEEIVMKQFKDCHVKAWFGSDSHGRLVEVDIVRGEAPF